MRQSPMVLDNGVLKQKPHINKAFGRQVQSGSNKKETGPSLGKLKTIMATGSPRIAVVRQLGGIGDVLMTTPALRALKHEWPTCLITYATDFKYMGGCLKDILRHNPYIDELIAYQAMSSKEFDFITDVTSVCVGIEKRGGNNVPNRIDIFADHIGVDLSNTGYLPVYIVTDEEKKWAHEKLSRNPKRPEQSRVGVVVGTSTKARDWSLGKFRDLVIRLSQQKDIQVCVFTSSFGTGSEGEMWNFPGVVVFKDYQIRNVAALLDKMDLVVTPDTGPMHIAGALNKKIVSIFAGIDYKSRVNHYPNAIALAREDLACYPCFYDASPCKQQYTCINSISVDGVMKTIYQQLDKPFISVQEIDTQVPRRELPKTLANKKAHSLVGVRRTVGGYGDIVCTTCAMRELKVVHPEQSIVAIMPKKYHCIFDGNEDVDFCIDPMDLFSHKPSVIYDITKVDAAEEVRAIQSGRSIDFTRPEVYMKHTVGKVPTEADKFIPSYFVSEEESQWIRERALKNDKYKYVALAISSAEEYRDWPEERYFELFDLAKKHKDLRFVIIDSSRTEWKLPRNVIDMTGFSFRRSMSVIGECEAFIGPDTSGIHVAAALNKPCISLFGPIDPKARVKHYPKHSVITCEDKLNCMHCWRNNTMPCKHGDKVEGNLSYCMTKITAEQVLNKLEQVLEEETE